MPPAIYLLICICFYSTVVKVLVESLLLSYYWTFWNVLVVRFLPEHPICELAHPPSVSLLSENLLDYFLRNPFKWMLLVFQFSFYLGKQAPHCSGPSSLWLGPWPLTHVYPTSILVSLLLSLAVFQSRFPHSLRILAFDTQFPFPFYFLPFTMRISSIHWLCH